MLLYHILTCKWAWFEENDEDEDEDKDEDKDEYEDKDLLYS